MGLSDAPSGRSTSTEELRLLLNHRAGSAGPIDEGNALENADKPPKPSPATAAVRTAPCVALRAPQPRQRAARPRTRRPRSSPMRPRSPRTRRTHPPTTTWAMRTGGSACTRGRAGGTRNALVHKGPALRMLKHRRAWRMGRREKRSNATAARSRSTRRMRRFTPIWPRAARGWSRRPPRIGSAARSNSIRISAMCIGARRHAANPCRLPRRACG